MKAAIGLVLVFTGLTVGYLVLTGRLPASASSAGTTSYASGNPIPGANTQTQRKVAGLPGNTGGGQMQASVPESVARGQLAAVKPVRAGGY